MKELSIEEKAKAYDIALKKIKSLLGTGSNCSREELEYVFPELKESEDEKIIRSITRLIKAFHNVNFPTPEGFSREDLLVWLEKQGTPAKLSEEEQNIFAEGVLTSCALSFIDYLDAHKYEGKMCVSNGECVDIENAFHNAMWDRLHRYYCKYIEKQDEQKPVEPQQDMLSQEKYAKAVDECIYGKHMPADKVEPKFKIGDRIIGIVSGMPYFITEICDDYYNTESGCIIMFCAQDNFELYEQNNAWSEQDEKIYNLLYEEYKNIAYYSHSREKAEDIPGEVLGWLKSLKDRYTWKPSNEAD